MSLISKSENLCLPSSVCLSALLYVTTHLNRNLFSVFAALPVGLSPWQPATTSSTHRCAPVAAHRRREQDVTRCVMPGKAAVGRPVIHVRCYRRYKWHTHPLWPPPASAWTPTIDRIHGPRYGCTLCALVIGSDRWLGGVGRFSGKRCQRTFRLQARYKGIKMGSTTSCCVSSSPKLRRNAHSRLESYHQESDLSREETGCNLQHISDRENVDGNISTLVSDDMKAKPVITSMIRLGLVLECYMQNQGTAIIEIKSVGIILL